MGKYGPPNETTMAVLDKYGFRPVQDLKDSCSWVRAKNIGKLQLHIWWRQHHQVPGAASVGIGHPINKDECEYESGIGLGWSWNKSSLDRLVRAAIRFAETVDAIMQKEPKEDL